MEKNRKIIPVFEDDDSDTDSSCDEFEEIHLGNRVDKTSNKETKAQIKTPTTLPAAKLPKKEIQKQKTPPEENTEYAEKRSMRNTQVASKNTTCISSYDFLKNWSFHKNSKLIDPFVSLLNQIVPSKLPQGIFKLVKTCLFLYILNAYVVRLQFTVITNKLDGPMLEKLVMSCLEFVKQGSI